jgi:hypothetical protein
MPQRELKVFVSSTSNDLHDYRAVARNVILEMGWVPKMMEYFGAIPAPTVEACKSMLKECDVVLLLVGFQRGCVPTPEQGGDGTSSFTALELAFAHAQRIPVLAMLASETWPQNLCERDASAREWVERFRADLNLPAEFFDYEPPTTDEARRLAAFRTKVRGVLLAQRERMARQEPPENGGVDYFAGARALLLEGNCIPFLGPGVHSDALSTPALVRELWPDVPVEQACLATAAEYAERILPSREAFLQRFERILSKQSAQAPSPPAHELVAHLRLQPPIPLLVSASHDMVLESRLAAAGTCAVVAHVVRSWNGEHDGKLLVLAPGRAPEICLADKLDVGKVDFIVYKPLGSPLLHARLDPDLEIDTVVATEADHLTFLGRLENQHTKVPSAFHRPFQRRPVLFLGLPLNVWHYRLVLQVFKSVELGSGRARSLAVCEPVSTMEKLAWQNLHGDAIRMDPNRFAARVMEAPTPPSREHAHGG